MDEFVEIPVPEHIDVSSNQALITYFRKFAGTLTEPGILAEALDPGCDLPNRIAILEDLRIHQVSINGDSIELLYSTELSEFQACRNVSENYAFDRKLMGKQIGSRWRFRKHVDPASRSTHDEL